MEYLTRMIKINTAKTGFKFHPKCAKMCITHLAFADDLILFSRGDEESVSVLINTLNPFGDVSGLHINPQNSKICVAGISQFECSVLQNITNFALGEFPVKYLGVPLTHRKTKISHFAPMIESISDHI